MTAAKGNKYAEKWTKEEARGLFDAAIKLSQTDEYDFIGEIAKALKTYIDVFDYLVDKFPELEEAKNHIMRNCEATCFSNSKKGKIKEGTALVNLKSNHGWTDRTDNKYTGSITIDFTDD